MTDKGFLKFDRIGTSPSGKTDIFEVRGSDGSILGRVSWYAPWRKYVIEVGGKIFDASCLAEIAGFLQAATGVHAAGQKVKARHQATQGVENGTEKETT